MKNFEKIIFEFWIEIFVFEFWKKLAIGNGKILKNNFEIWKIEICHKKLKWKFPYNFFKKLAISPNGNEKTIEMKKSYISFMPPR
jgi:hypothetical protein